MFDAIKRDQPPRRPRWEAYVSIAPSSGLRDELGLWVVFSPDGARRAVETGSAFFLAYNPRCVRCIVFGVEEVHPREWQQFQSGR